MKYIYFEIHRDSRYVKTFTIQNVNGLVYRPHTNSTGWWGFTNATYYYNGYKLIVEQYWIDMDKYDSATYVNRYMNDVMTILKKYEEELLVPLQ